MKIDARLTFNKIQADQETEAHLVLGLTAPAVDVEAKRPPLCIVPLIDVSPSMYGEKLMYAKRSLLKLIDHLSANDYCGLVSFSSAATVESRPVKCTVEAKEELKKKVEELQIGNATNIADALLTGCQLGNQMDLAAEVITRVILFTDGMANMGPATTSEQIVALTKANVGITSVSAFGYGDDVKQDFLLDLAKTGNGNYAFVENPDDALSAFGKELGGLLSTYANNLVVDVTALAGHEITQVVSDVEAAEDDFGQVTIKIPDLLSEETRNIVLAVKLKAQKAGPRAVNVFETKVGYDTLDENLRREHHQDSAKVKAQFVKDDAQATPDPEVDRIVALAQIVRAQIEAEEHAKAGKYDMAANVMAGVSRNIGNRGLNDLVIAAQSLGDRMSSRANYMSNTSYLAGFSSGATRGLGGTYGSAVAADLSTLGVSMSNSSQALVSSSFEVDDYVAPDPQVQIGTPDPDMQVQIGDFPNSNWSTDNPRWQTITHASDLVNPNLDADQLAALQQAIEDAQAAAKPPADPEPVQKIDQKPTRW